MSELFSADNQRIQDLKDVIRAVHAGIDKEEAKKILRKKLPDLQREEFVIAAQQLDDEGLSMEDDNRVKFFMVNEIERNRNLIFSESLPQGHPVQNYLEENKMLRNWAQQLEELTDLENNWDQFSLLVQQLAQVDTHFLRKENQLFPFLEQKGFTHPSTGMWRFHDEIRALIKALQSVIGEKQLEKVREQLPIVLQEVRQMCMREEKVLLPTALELLDEENWVEIRRGEEEIGWLLDTVPPLWPANSQKKKSKNEALIAGLLKMDEGLLEAEQINLIFRAMPMDITFVDENDQVRFYNRGEKRVFPRSPGIIGRKVEYCHPPKSVDMVLEILKEFRAGTQDTAEFWIPYRDQFIHIHYEAVRDDAGNYRGVLEITQDISHFRSLEGEKRLLDWEK